MTKLSLRRNVLICLCLAVAIAAVYAPVRHFQFTNYDDDAYITGNSHVQAGLTFEGVAWAFTNLSYDHWMPLTWLIRMFECQVFGLNAGAHHLINVALHTVNTLLLFVVLTKMTVAPWRSAFVAALFALHPLHVESVAWVTELKDMLSACFWMLAIWTYIRYVEQPGRARYILTLGLYTLGLMAKPMVMTLPFVLLLLDYWPLGRTRWADPSLGKRASLSLSRLLREKLPFFALTIVSCGLTLLQQRYAGAVTSLERLPIADRVANAVVSYVRYLGDTFCPSGLAVFYPQQRWPWATIVGATAILVAVSGWVIWRPRRKPHQLVGWLWYLGTLVPVIGLVQSGGQSMADRYTYLPLIGVFIMAAWAIPSSVFERRIPQLIAAAGSAALLGVCALLSRVQVGYWKDSGSLFRHALQVTDGNYLAHLNLGNALLDNGKVQDAIEQFNLALRISPDYAKAHNALGIALAQAGRTSEAIEHFELALRFKPDFAEAHYNLGHALILAGNVREAVTHFEQELRITPDDAEAHYNLGNALVALGRLPEATTHWEQAVRLRPDFAEAHNNLGLALKQAGDVQSAVREYEQALRIKPDYVEAQNNLAWLLAVLPPAAGGDPIQAVSLAQQVCERTGNHAPAYLDTLAVAYAAAGRFDIAVVTAQKAIELARADGQTQLVNEIQARLEMYRDSRPYR